MIKKVGGSRRRNNKADMTITEQLNAMVDVFCVECCKWHETNSKGDKCRLPKDESCPLLRL